MKIWEITLTNYVPMITFGLFGLLATYLYIHLKHKYNNQLDGLSKVKSENQIAIIHAELNRLEVNIDTASFTIKQKYDLLAKVLSVKAGKFLTLSITFTILAIIAVFLLGLPVLNKLPEGSFLKTVTLNFI
ncbi:MAG: hypothetical protein JWR50_4209 [Mucilaginibacter sp.]|nr:hypothetical protein [Mucilaginibacter sp.]